ncbi:hypothetical protein M5D96_009713 [Drosophila gunungcola]|uniref:Uncharacterized protein n=1 Tax=Drosophila gunungcola TaxID=103775 RepID=A0A9P9YIU7_9MUSC|nr:hypothetical protein M5D96_009713 [Drosophila gunungcola]
MKTEGKSRDCPKYSFHLLQLPHRISSEHCFSSAPIGEKGIYVKRTTLRIQEGA